MIPAIEAIKAVSRGDLVTCTKEEYYEVRKALQDFAGKSIDSGDVFRANIALSEVQRLDIRFDFWSNHPSNEEHDNG